MIPLLVLCLTLTPHVLHAQTGSQGTTRPGGIGSPAGSSSMAATTSIPPVTFSLLHNEKEGIPYRQDWITVQEILQRKNVRFSVRSVPDAQYGSVLPGIFASGNIPDIILKVWPDQLAKAGSEGLLLPVNDYEHLLPNFRRYIKENGLQSEVDALRDEHGNYYLLPGFQREIQVQQWIYRKDLFDKHGLGVPATFEELLQDLVILKKLYPSSRPLTACWAGAHLFAMGGSAFGVPAGWSGDRLYDKKSDRWLYAPLTRNWQELFRFFSRCYQAGVLDPDVFTQDPQAYTKKLTDGTSFVTVSWISAGFSSWNAQLTAAGIAGAEWSPLMVPKSPVGIQALPGISRFRKGAAIPARVVREPYFRRLMEFLDWLFYSEEGQILSVWGEEGVTYEVSGGKKHFLPHIRSLKFPAAPQEHSRDYGLNTMFDLCEVPDYEDAKKPQTIVRFLEEVLRRKLTEPLPPALQLSPEDQQAVSMLSGELNPYMTDMVKAFITGKSDIDRDWPGFTATLEKKGARKLEKLWNDAWSERKTASR